MAKTKLHELLAVEGNLKEQANTARKDLLNTFEKKRHLFKETRKVFHSTEENGPKEDEITEALDLNTTVPREIEWIRPMLQKAMDASYQVCEGNMGARGAITLEDGTVIAANVPATALMELGHRLKDLQTFVAGIPTLDPAKGFKLDPARSSDGDVFQAREERKPKTRKNKRGLLLSPPTDKHPAQVTLIEEDIPIGYYLEQEWSGLVTPARKADLLGRVEDLVRATKQALSRANEIELEVSTHKIGSKLLTYVFAESK